MEPVERKPQPQVGEGGMHYVAKSGYHRNGTSGPVGMRYRRDLPEEGGYEKH